MFRSASAVVAIAMIACATGCFEDRVRPDPSDILGQADLSVQILEPRHGITVLGDRPLTVRVLGRDLRGDQLVGVGFVARRSGSGSATIDSIAFRPGNNSLLEHAFEFDVPDLPTNTQIDIFAVAYGPGTQARLSVPSSVIVVRCQPGIPGC